MTATVGPVLEDIDRIIHEPTRLLIVAHLAIVDEADFVYLSARTGLTDGNISSHAAKLAESGYVRIEKSLVGGRTRTVYSLTGEGKTALDAYRRTMSDLLG